MEEGSKPCLLRNGSVRIVPHFENWKNSKQANVSDTRENKLLERNELSLLIELQLPSPESFCALSLVNQLLVHTSSFNTFKMPAFKTFAWFLATSLSFWRVSVATEAMEKPINMHEQALHRRWNQPEKRAASSSLVATSASASISASASFSSSSYVPSFPASSTIDSPLPSYSYIPMPTPASCGSEDCKFYTSKTAPYFIREWPMVNFDAGEFYGGSTPVRTLCEHKSVKRPTNANRIVCPGIRSTSLTPVARCSGFLNRSRAIRLMK